MQLLLQQLNSCPAAEWTAALADQLPLNNSSGYSDGGSSSDIFHAIPMRLLQLTTPRQRKRKQLQRFGQHSATTRTAAPADSRTATAVTARCSPLAAPVIGHARRKAAAATAATPLRQQLRPRTGNRNWSGWRTPRGGGGSGRSDTSDSSRSRRARGDTAERFHATQLGAARPPRGFAVSERQRAALRVTPRSPARHPARSRAAPLAATRGTRRGSVPLGAARR